METVGPGGSPDENGETTIDAMVMDGVITFHLFLQLLFLFFYFLMSTYMQPNDKSASVLVRKCIGDNGGWSCCCHEVCQRWHQSC